MSKYFFTLLLFFMMSNAQAFEFWYKIIYFDIPDDEITGASIANFQDEATFLDGRDWTVVFSDTKFEKDCASLAEKVKTIDCNKSVRIKMLDSLVVGDKRTPAAQIFFSVQEDGKILRKEFNNYVLYTSVAPKKEVALLVRKRDGRTIHIYGKFGDKHLKWLRLEPCLDAGK